MCIYIYMCVYAYVCIYIYIYIYIYIRRRYFGTISENGH